jgi:predicted RNA-binding protein with RPS1 domain
MNEEQKIELYDFVQQGLEKEGQSISESCAEFASLNSLSFKECQEEYVKVSAEQTKLRQNFEKALQSAIKMSEKKIHELNGVVSPKHRQFEEWESELLDLAVKANRSMSRLTLSKYLADVLPHRTAGAYAAKLYRSDVKNKKLKPVSSQDNKHLEGIVTECIVTKIMDYGAILTTHDGKKGLLHISEINNSYIDNIYNYLYEGQKIKAVITIKNGRLGFSTKKIGGIKKLDPDFIPPAFEVVDKVPDIVQPKAEEMVRTNNVAMCLNEAISRFEEGLISLKKLRGMVEEESDQIKVLKTVKDQLLKLL